MSTDWNPNLDDVLGLEWFPTIKGGRVLNAASKAAALKFRSTGAATVDGAQVYIDGDHPVRPNSARWLLEVYEEGDEIPGAVSSFTAEPDGVVSGGADWPNEAPATSTTANIGASIGEADLDTSGYIQYVGTYQDKTPIRLEFDTAAWPADRRVVGGRLVVVTNREEASGRLIFSYRPQDGGNYLLGDITVDTELRTFEIPFPEINPATGLPWTQNDIKSLDHSFGDDDTIRVKPVGIGKHKPLRIYQMYLEIDWVDENRVTWGLVNITGSTGGWFTCTLPSAWVKADDTTYMVMLRRIPLYRNIGTSTDVDTAILNGGQVSWRYLEEAQTVAEAMGRDVALPDPYMASYTPLLNGDGTIADLGDPRTRGYAVVFFDGATYTDGIPYADFMITDADNIVGRQYLTTDAGGTYDRVRLLVAPRSEAVDDITIGVYDSGGVLIAGSEITVTLAELADEVSVELTPSELGPIAGELTTFYFLERDFDTPVELDPATQYSVRVDGPTGETTSWDLLLLTTFASGNEELTFGGTTDSAYTGTFSGPSSYVDAPLTLVVAPDAPADFDVAVGTQTLISDTQALTPDWLIHDLEFAELTWTSTSLDTDFSYYEIQRSQDFGETWEAIARITDEAVALFRDYEAKRNVEAGYRMRVMSTWFVASDWTSDEAVTLALDSCALLFVSNEDPSINQGYVDIGGERTWTFQSADERETHILVGRSYQVVTAPLENRGDRFEVDLAVWAGSVPEDTGRARFDAIEAFNQVAVSYVCVLDETGRRWLADVAIGEGTRTGSKIHTASATVIEITDTPSLVDVSSVP